MRLRVLGSGAGGGVPQWNCGCGNCQAARAGGGEVASRTQDSVAVSAGGSDARWFLLNASPDVRAQIEAFPALWPRDTRDSGVAGVVLTNGDLDHCLGLLCLRESQPIVVYATESVREGLLAHNAFFRTLQRSADQVRWRTLELDVEVPLAVGEPAARDALVITALAVPGKLPIHLEGLCQPSPGDNVAVRVRDLRSGRSVIYAPGVGGPGGAEVLSACDCLLLDGTFFSEDELRRLDPHARLARDMAHWPVGGAEGSLARVKQPARRIYTHVNNTNPMLRAGSPERRAVEAGGWEVAVDGLEVEP